MAMTVNKVKDARTPHVFIHKLADIRGGVSVDASELGGDYLKEGAVLSKPINGITHVVKVAIVAAEVAAEATEIALKKGHNFKVGDILASKTGGTAVTITAINAAAKTTDTITVDKALGTLAIGDFVVEASKAGAAAALKYEPFALNGTGQRVDPRSNIITDAWIIGVTTGNELPSFIAEKLSGIINY
jgi:hypothetical protein